MVNDGRSADQPAASGDMQWISLYGHGHNPKPDALRNANSYPYF